MALTFPVPNDATYDYVHISGPQVQVGTDLLSCWTVEGAVTSAFDEGGGGWTFFMVNENPDGSTSVGVAFFLVAPGSMPSDWWDRQAIWKRAAKLSDGASLTAADGSKWRYPAGEDGRMVCTHAGTTFARGDRKFRGELTTNPDDYWICDDPDWDWLPISDGSQVTVGDTIRFLYAVAGAVDSVTVTENDQYKRTSFFDVSSTQLGWWDAVYQAASVVDLNLWTFFQRLSKPSTDTSFRAPDGSRWDYVGSSLYYCWGRGTTYAPGAIFNRGQIAGGLTPIA